MSVLRKFSQMFEREEKEPIELRTIGLYFKENEGSLKAYYKIIDNNGGIIEIPARNEVKAIFEARVDPNFYVLRAKDRLIVLYGDEHMSQLVRSNETYQNMIEYFEDQAKTELKLAAVEGLCAASYQLDEIGLKREVADFPENAFETFKKWIREINEENEIEVSPFTLGTLIWHLSRNAEDEMLHVRRNASAIYKILKLAKHSPLIAIYGGAHIPDMVDILNKLGYRTVKRKKLDHDSFLTDEENKTVEVARYIASKS